MDQHRNLQIHPVEALVQIRQDHNGKFKALGLVDAHDLYPAGGASRRYRRLLPCLQQKPQVADKAEQPLVSRAFKGLGVLIQSDQVLTPTLSIGHGPEYAKDIQTVVQQPHQPLGAQVLC